MTARAHLLDDVEIVTAGHGPIVALAHGAGGGVNENFAGLIAAGRDRFRFTGPSMPGVGSTPLPPEPLELEVLADRLIAAAELEGGERFPIVGISLGAAVAIAATVRHPERVSALVLTVPFARPDAQSRSFTDVWRALDASGDRDALAQHLFSGCTTTAALSATSVDDAHAITAAVRDGYPAGGAAHAELIGRVDVTGLFDAVDVPALVVIGGQDRLLLPNTCRLYAGIPGAHVLEYPDAGHIFDETTAQRWNADVLRFLAAQH